MILAGFFSLLMFFFFDAMDYYLDSSMGVADSELCLFVSSARPAARQPAGAVGYNRQAGGSDRDYESAEILLQCGGEVFDFRYSRGASTHDRRDAGVNRRERAPGGTR